MKKLLSVVWMMAIIIAFCQCAPKEPAAPAPVKNVILLIGDGMGVAQVYAGMTANKGTLALDRSQFVGFSKTYSADNYITDSAAGGTAIACGEKTDNGMIGQTPDGTPVKSMLEYADEQGYATGVVVTSSVTHATPASFLAHQPNRNMEEEIALDILNLDVDVFIGGGKKFFEARADQQNLSDKLRAKGYQMVYTLDDVKAAQSGKLGGLLAENGMPQWDERGDMLPVSVETAIRLLSPHPKGFFLMVEGSQIDSRCHGNDGVGAIGEMIDFDKAVKLAFDFADKNPNTLVVVTADHETGGMTINGGGIETGEVVTSFTTGGHTAVMVPVFAYGARAAEFAGIYENTDILGKVLSLMNIPK